MSILDPNTKLHKISREEARSLYGKIYADNMVFNPILTQDMDIVVTEQEVIQADKKEFPFLDEANLKYPDELSKQNLSEEAQLQATKADIEKNLQEVTAKLAEISKSTQTEDVKAEEFKP